MCGNCLTDDQQDKIVESVSESMAKFDFPPAVIIARSRYPELYLDWVNNFITVERFAEYYEITIEHANEIIQSGRDSDNFTKDTHIKYSIVELKNGM